MVRRIKVGRTLRQIWSLVASHLLLTLHQVIVMILCQVSRHILLLLNLNSFISFAALIRLLILNLMLNLLLLWHLMMMRDLIVFGGHWGGPCWAKRVRGKLIFRGEMLLLRYLVARGEATSGRGLDIGLLSSWIPLGWKELYHIRSGSWFRSLGFDLNYIGLGYPELDWALTACFLAWSPLR